MASSDRQHIAGRLARRLTEFDPKELDRVPAECLQDMADLISRLDADHRFDWSKTSFGELGQIARQAFSFGLRGTPFCLEISPEETSIECPAGAGPLPDVDLPGLGTAHYLSAYEGREVVTSSQRVRLVRSDGPSH